SDALPAKPRSVTTFTPYSTVGASSTPNSADRSHDSRSTISVSEPSGRWGPCCSQVPTGTTSRGSRSTSAATSRGRSRLTKRVVRAIPSPLDAPSLANAALAGTPWGVSLISADRVIPDRQSPRRRWPSPAPWTSWAVAAGAALLIASQWLHGPSVEYLVPLVVATLAALWFAFAIRGAERWWAVGCSFALAAAAALAVPAERNLWLVQHRWDVWRHDAVVHGLASLGHQIDDAAAAAGRAADQALAVAGDTTDDRSHAFDQLSRLVGGGDERGVVVYRADSALAWAGIIRPPIDKFHDGVTVIGTPFYLALQTSRRRGDERAVAVALIDAAPPADELSASVAHRVAIETNLGRFVFGPPTDTASGPEVLRYSSGGVRLFNVRSDTLMQGQVEQRISEAERAR